MHTGVDGAPIASSVTSVERRTNVKQACTLYCLMISASKWHADAEFAV